MTEFVQTPLPGVWEITPRRFGDHRGFFSESYSAKVFVDHGIDLVFVQDNHSLSATVGTVRGLHFQSPPHAQGKLVRCGKGKIFDVAVDVRRGSPTYGQWYGAELSFENGKQLLVPAGFLHGFMTLEPDSEIVYKCTDFYAPDCDGGVRWNDPDIGITWPETGTTPVLSAKDETATLLADFDSPFIYEEPKA
ncbi:dTDP-4-dehydrorhamnose 3,5-epimerase [Roseovarius sp.]|jgi:dTDP-4-dehydrorhamnose 3,5-epimerase|uniref:dTDP-4-dehydrorhamnose 3,5-epimerase n=1 Tax=Roseovarius sp. TaxID=1486281 RepID=UPI000C486251|nr:dTDP-4-dehydrorhamnose 3,5-epimerase [Roseovarius sp.]MAZ20502.1 dTDP-4-dehydrorhamnose 3,5-epimerase [Roseovarius sp.]